MSGYATLPATPKTKVRAGTLPGSPQKKVRVGNVNLAKTIDTFLKNRDSPMAGMGKVFVGMGHKYGVDPRLIVAISGIESSFGKHILGSYNAWGWGPGKPFSSWEEGIRTVTQGLRSGYLDRGLKTPETIVNRYAPGSDGNDTGNWVRVVNQFLSELGGSPKNVSTPAMSPVPTTQAKGPTPPDLNAPVFELPPFDPGPQIRQSLLSNLGDIARTGKADPMNLLASAGQMQANIASARAAYDTQAEYLASLRPKGPAVNRDPGGRGGTKTTPTGKSKTYSFDGEALIPGAQWKGTHVTDGLDWNNGRKTAIDIMADEGTPVGAPMSGTITRHGSAQQGDSLYFTTDGGIEFWMGHILNALPVGTHVKKGQPIAVIGPHSNGAHLHIDRKW